jgi:Ras GTPase-activating-like protein IQGAP2/3
MDELSTAPAQVPRKENRTLELHLYSRWETPVQDIQSALMDSVSSSEMLYMETKSIFVQLIRSLPQMADKRPYNLSAIAERAATTKDATLVRKGIKVKEMLRELEEQKIVDRSDGYRLMQEEVAQELIHLGNLREKVILETKSLEAVYKTICDHNNYLRGQLEQYKAYLQNVRLTASKDKGATTGVGVVTVGGKEKKPVKPQVLGPYRFTHAQLEKEGIIVESNVPDNRYVRSGWDSVSELIVPNRRPNIYFNITSPTPGTFIIALHYKGRERAILEMDLNIDDLLEKVSFPPRARGSSYLCRITFVAKGQQASLGSGIRTAERTEGSRAAEQGFHQAMKVLIPLSMRRLSFVLSLGQFLS